MKRFLLLILFVARLAADSALTTATENKALYATTIATTADIGGAVTASSLAVTNNTTVGGTLGVTGNTTIGGLLLQPTHSLTASTTLTSAHQFVIVSDSAGDVVLTLADPTVLTNVNVTLMKRAGTNRTTITSTALINGIADTLPLPILEAVTLRSNGANWFVVSAAQETSFTARTATGALTVGDVRNSYNDSAGSITVTLPSATNYSTLGRIYYHKKTGGGNTTTLDPAGSETIGGAATLSLSTLGGVAIYSDLVNWHVLADSGIGGGSGDALVANPLSQFAATTSAQLAGVISDETGSGALVFGTAPQISTIELGHASDTTLARSAAGEVTVEGKKITGGEFLEWALSDETTALTTGTAKVTDRAPFAMTITAVRASLATASSSGLPTVDINEGGTTILSTKLTIDASEKTSTTAATAAVISDTAIADDAELTFDIDTAGTGAAGLKVRIYYTR